MTYEGTIYEAMGYSLKPYHRDFIDAFLRPLDQGFDLTDGVTDKEYSGVSSSVKHYLKPLLVAYEIEPTVWSLNLYNDPDTVIAQIDHDAKMLRHPEVETPEAVTAQGVTIARFNKIYRKAYSTKRSQVLKKLDSDYSTTTQVIKKDFTKKNYITRLDISSLWAL